MCPIYVTDNQIKVMDKYNYYREPHTILGQFTLKITSALESTVILEITVSALPTKASVIHEIALYQVEKVINITRRDSA